MNSAAARRSTSAAIVGSIRALSRALVKIDGKHWTAVNDAQREWLSLFTSYRYGLAVLSEDELATIWADNADKINEFLSERGFPDLQLDPFPLDRPTIGVATALKLGVKWKRPGTEVKILNTYPGVQIERHFSTFEMPSHRHPIFCIDCENGDKVFMTPFDDDADGFNLLHRVREFSQAMRPSRPLYRGVVFPMIDYDQVVDVSYLKNMTTCDPSGLAWDITQAKQQDRFKMNHFGALAESAFTAAVTARGVDTRKLFTIDSPFLLWIQRSSFDLPIFVGNFAEDSWKNPGTINFTS